MESLRSRLRQQSFVLPLCTNQPYCKGGRLAFVCPAMRMEGSSLDKLYWKTNTKEPYYGQQHSAGASFAKDVCVLTRGQMVQISMSLTEIRCAKYKACIHNYQERWIVGDDAKRLSRLEIPHIFANDGCVGQIRNLVFSGCCIDGAHEDDSYRNATVQTQSVASVCSFLCVSMYFYSFLNPECGFWYVASG